MRVLSTSSPTGGSDVDRKPSGGSHGDGAAIKLREREAAEVLIEKVMLVAHHADRNGFAELEAVEAI